jgi:hypothetical protein
MATTLITPTIVAKEALIVLENNMVMGNLVHRGYEKEYQSIGATVVARKPTSFTATAFSSTVGYSTITESSVSVILNQHWDVSFEITSQELSLDVVDFTEQFLTPAGRAIAQAVDATIFVLASTAIASHYPVTSTPVVADIAGLEAVQDVMKVPRSDRRLVFHPVTRASYMALDSFLNADKRGDGPQALRDAELGRILGYDTYVDQNVYRFTSSMDATAAAALSGTCGAAGTVGGTALNVASLGTSEVINIGDVFKVTGYDAWHVVTTAATQSGGSAVVGFSPAMASAYTIGSVVTFQGSSRVNLAFHKNAFALVTAPLAPPIGGAKAAVLSYNNLACRVVYGYDQQYKKNQMSVDMLCGFKVLDKDLAARLVDAR